MDKSGKQLRLLLHIAENKKPRLLRQGFLLIALKNYREIAPQGHSPTQAPHSMHFSSSILATPSTISIASTGQAATQTPQPAQAELSTLAAIFHFSLRMFSDCSLTTEPRIRSTTYLFNIHQKRYLSSLLDQISYFTVPATPKRRQFFRYSMPSSALSTM